jgi:hypothetical protein
LEKKGMSATVEFEKQEIRRLIALMKSSAYWRDRDPDVMREVRIGFRRLYGKPAEPTAPAQGTREVQTAA